MKSAVEIVRQCLGISLLGTLSFGGLSTSPFHTIGTRGVTSLRVTSSVARQDSMEELFSSLIARHLWQRSHLDRYSTARTYQVENDKDKILAQEVVDMEYRAPGTETFTRNSAKGSGFILHEVFQRLMQHEAARVGANKDPDSLITPDNYTFEMVGTDQIAGSECSVVHAVPKRKEIDLFDGRIWIDNRDSAVVKISGHLAKSPSFWIKRVDFERDYRKIDGFWLLSREEAVSVVRMFGKETLTVDYRTYRVNGSGALQSLLRVRGTGRGSSKSDRPRRPALSSTRRGEISASSENG